MKIFSLALAVILGVALLAACGGGEDEEDNGAAEATTEAPAAAATAGATGTPRQGSPTASPSGSGVQTVGCDFPSDIESFRFEMTMKANLPSTPETSTPEAASGVGAPMASGKYLLTVDSIIDPYTSPNPLSRPTDGKRFVAIDVTIANIGEKGNIPYNPFYFVLIDPSDFVYEVGFVVTENDLRSGELGAGEKATGLVAFEVPADTEIAKIKFKPPLEKDIVIPVTGEEDMSDLLGGLSGLMGDMKMEGAYIKPDRSSMVMTVGGHEFSSFIQIGSQSWMKVAGLTDWTEQSSEESEFMFSPLDLCESAEESLSTSLSQLEGKKETVNGIKAIHYHIDKADLTFLQGLLGDTEDLGELPDEFNMDVWLAEDGDWPVRMTFKASGEDDNGEALSFDISIEFKDFNDSSIEIEPPT